jgi:hypothetical protein
MKQNINEIKRMQQLAGLVVENEYQESKIKEAKLSKLDDGVANLYAWAGIKTEYSDDTIKRFGKNVVNRAIEMAPKILEYKKKLKQIVKDIEDSDESKILMAMIGHGRGYAGNYGHSPANISDLFKLN